MDHGPNPAWHLNKILLEHSHTICLHIVYGCFQATEAWLSSCNKDHVEGKARSIYFMDFSWKCFPIPVVEHWSKEKVLSDCSNLWRIHTNRILSHISCPRILKVGPRTRTSNIIITWKLVRSSTYWAPQLAQKIPMHVKFENYGSWLIYQTRGSQPWLYCRII